MSVASEFELQMLALINAERAAAGLQALKINAKLNTSAETHSRWMLQADVFSHTGSGGSSAGDRMRAAGYVFSGTWANGENIAWQSQRGAAGISDDVINLHTALMNSTGHRANILNSNFTEIGIGIEIGEFTAGGRAWPAVIVTQNFAKSSADNGGATDGPPPPPPPPEFVVTDTADVITGTSAANVIDALGGNDRLSGMGGADTLRGGLANDTLFGGEGNDRLEGGLNEDALYGGDSDDRLMGGDGNDTAAGDAGNDHAAGGAGTDSLTGGLGNDTLLGEAGGDVLLGNEGRDSLNGGAGNDRVEGGAENDTMLGDLGLDTLTGDAGDDVLYGGSGSDRVDGGVGNDLVFGGYGNDMLFGGTGNDSLSGGYSNDTLEGGAGADVLTGGLNQDSFVFRPGFGADRVVDFLDNADTLVFGGGLWNGSMTVQTFVYTYAKVSGSSVIFDFGSGNVLTVNGVDALTKLYDDISFTA